MAVKNVHRVEYREEERVIVRKNSLWEALDLDLKEHMVICFTGGGGKTSSIFALANELALLGKQVLVTTSTHMFYPDSRNVVLAESAEEVKAYQSSCMRTDAQKTGSVLVTGQRAEDGKLKGLPDFEMEKLSFLADILLVEADGAKRLPLKIPGNHEPVILYGADAVIGCAGLDAVGGMWESVCFRWELAEKILGWKVRGNVVTPYEAAFLLTSEFGTKKGVGTKQYRMILNKADDDERLGAAAAVLAHMNKTDAKHCVITSFPVPICCKQEES